MATYNLYRVIRMLLTVVAASILMSACQTSTPEATTTPIATATAPMPGTPTVVMPVATPTNIPTTGPTLVPTLLSTPGVLPRSRVISDSDTVFTTYSEPPVNAVVAIVQEPIAPDLANVLVPFTLSEAQRERLAQDGLVVEHGTELEFFNVYEKVRYDNTPPFVTSDSLVHTYHLLFDKVLRTAEQDQLRPRLISLNEAILTQADLQYRALQGTPWQEPARRTVAYIGVSARLVNPAADIPAYAKDLVDAEVAQVESHSGRGPSPIFPGLAGGADYTMFIPRGHYTLTPELTAYFKSMMWYGTMTFRLTADDPDVGRDETRSALLLVQALRTTAMTDGKSAVTLWKDIYYTTAFFAGQSNNLTMIDYSTLMDQVYGPNIRATDLTDEAKLDVFIVEAKKLQPTIAQSLISPDEESVSDAAKGLQMMGQRFAPDTYIFDQLLYARVGTDNNPRWFPKGLDVMAAFGSQRAYSILDTLGETQYANYPEQMTRMQGWTSGFTADDWTASLYTTWLFSLQPLLAVPDDGYPQFMRSEAWLDKQINASLGSWTELRHDTILYTQPGYPEAGGGPKPPTGPYPLRARGYVEPVPRFYARLRALAAMTRQGLAPRGMLSEQDNDSLQQMESLTQALQIISEKELSGTPLTGQEDSLIRSYGVEIENLLMASLTENLAGAVMSGNPAEAAVVADVVTSGNTVLEEAVGRVNPIYVVVPLVNPDGSIMLEVAKGGVFSYYEFTWPSNDRLTDQAWSGMLYEEKTGPVPEWTGSFLTTETTDNSIRDGIYNFVSRLGWAYWYDDTAQLKDTVSGDKVADYFAPIFKDLEDKKQIIKHVYVSGSYRSFDLESPSMAIVTVRETWQDELTQVSRIDKELGYHDNQQVIGRRGPYTLDVTYTVQNLESSCYGWCVTNMVYANKPPDW